MFGHLRRQRTQSTQASTQTGMRWSNFRAIGEPKVAA